MLFLSYFSTETEVVMMFFPIKINSSIKFRQIQSDSEETWLV